MAENTLDLLICNTCGTQYCTSSRAELKTCRTCDDPRQYVPRTGQSFTTIGELKASNKYKNEFTKVDDTDDKFWSIKTEPQFAIGQRAILVKSDQGNVLWDCITYLDEDTITWVKKQGGLSAIVISHPHYYSTHLDWATAFDCPVYIARDDAEWLNRTNPKSQIFLEHNVETLSLNGQQTDIQILKLGGHFPGSLVLLAHKRLLIADTIMTVPSGLGDWSIIPSPSEAASSDRSSPIPFPNTLDNSSSASSISHRIGERPHGLNSFSFMWSIPNQIPLNPSEIVVMWKLLKDIDFTSTHGAFKGMDIYDGYGGSLRTVKGRVLDSMQIQVRMMGWQQHEFLSENI